VAPDQDPAGPAALAPAITAIAGPGGNPTNRSTPLRLPPEAQSVVKPLAPQDLQHAYQLGTLAPASFDGAGDTVAILATTPFSQSDLMATPRRTILCCQLQVVSLPSSGSAPVANMEFNLDPSAMHAAAPGVTILIYELDCREGILYASS
jgi:subtilase family serine protease